MNLEELLNIHGKLSLNNQHPKQQVRGVFFDSRKVEPGSVYVAIAGHSQDGHDYIPQAIASGAIALVVEKPSVVPKNYDGAVMEVLDSRVSLQNLAQRFYDSPGNKLFSVAVTGTNGKTSTTYILEYLLNKVGQDCGVIGTIDHHIGSKKWQTNLTTPDPLTLQKRLQDFVDEGGKSFVIEASSHALDQNRIDQGFDVVMFSNLSRDHLDYHKDMDDYFEAKAKLFTSKMLKEDQDCFAVVNLDDPYGQRLEPMIEGRRVYTYGKSESSHLRFAIIENRIDGVDINLTVGGEHNFLVKSPLMGEHNVYNLVSCLAVIYGAGFNLLEAAKSFESFPGIPGRMQLAKSSKGIYGFVDYAHTPDALEKAISSVKPLLEDGKKLITVFGCGGDRDPGKRPMMAKVASTLGDVTIVTSDNPRTEDPGKIIQDICAGLVDAKSQCLPFIEREEAIKQACEMAEAGDAILVAGKGHEDYQIIGTEKKHFDDYEVLTRYLG